MSATNPFDNIPDEGDFPFYASAATSGPLQTMMLPDAADPFEEGLNVRVPSTHLPLDPGPQVDFQMKAMHVCNQSCSLSFEFL